MSAPPTPHQPHAQWTLIAVFLGLIWLPLAITLLGAGQSVSMTEKRKLAALPEVAWNDLDAYPRAFEDYYNDHFGLRSRLIRWYNIVKVRWLGVSNHDWVMVGPDGWLFQGGAPHFHDMRNAWPFTDQELTHWGQVLQRKHDWLRERGIAYLFVIAPNKHLVYGEKLPAQVKRVSDRGRVDQLVAHIRAQTDVSMLDLREPLIAAKNIRRTYHKTDTHWNAFGAYVGYREIMATLAPALPGSAALELPSQWTVHERDGGDLANILSLKDVLREDYIEPSEWRPQCARNLELGASADDRQRNQNSFTTECDRGKYRLLMFRDSYSLELMPYLSETFARAHYVPHSPVPVAGMQRVVREQQPDVVIEQRSSRWLRTPEG